MVRAQGWGDGSPRVWFALRLRTCPFLLCSCLLVCTTGLTMSPCFHSVMCVLLPPSWVWALRPLHLHPAGEGLDPSVLASSNSRNAHISKTLCWKVFLANEIKLPVSARPPLFSLSILESKMSRGSWIKPITGTVSSWVASPACTACRPHVVPLLQLVARCRHARESPSPLVAFLGTGACVGCREETNSPGQSRQQWCWPTRAALLPKGMTLAAVVMEGRATGVWLPCSTLLTWPARESFKPRCFVTQASPCSAHPSKPRSSPCAALSLHPCVGDGTQQNAGVQGKLGGAASSALLLQTFVNMLLMGSRESPLKSCCAKFGD